MLNPHCYTNFTEIAHAKFEERKRILAIINSLLVKFPEQFSKRRTHRIAKQVCSYLYREFKDKFNMF